MVGEAWQLEPEATGHIVSVIRQQGAMNAGVWLGLIQPRTPDYVMVTTHS